MKINVERLCVLAGVDSRKNRSGLMKESMSYDEGAVPFEEGAEMEVEEEEAAAPEGLDELSDDDVLEIDEKMLVQELRRAKMMLAESKKIQKRRKENLLEAELKTIIESEVESVLKDLNLNSQWMYGNKKPRRSKKGYVNQGSMLKGIGFK